MLKFISLGSSSSGNCYYLATDNTQILIDAGISVKPLRNDLKERGVMLTDIDAVFITHDHADHIKAVGHLAHDYHLPIYATEEVHRGINRNYCVTTKLTPEHTRLIQKSQTVEIGDLRVTAFSVPHDSSDCVGYRVETNEEIFLVITDIGHATELIQQEVSEANYIVLESNHDVDMLMMGPYPAHLKGRIRSGKGHLSNHETAKILTDYMTENLRHVWLCHLSEENNHPELARKTVDSHLRSFGIIAGKDFQLEVLKRRVPSIIYELNC
jgi:phosphoribosyl 1,2-cyclic phosphodiesterase